MPRKIRRLELVILVLAASSCARRDSGMRLRNVVLYQSGVGYFEHSGTAENERLRIPVRRFEVDDVLKTVTVVGQDKTGLAPRSGTARTPAQPADGGKDTDPSFVELWVPQSQGRHLEVSYAVPTPIWKATYRVVLDGAGKAALQGWAAIHNTSGSDWTDVELTLATGNPLSFDVDLSRPDYAERPDLAGELHRPVALGPVTATSAPPTDSDADGILDRVDQCPEEAETLNGYEDEDGCPDRGRVVVMDSSIEILEQIYFHSGSASISPESQPIIAAIASALQANLDITHIEVQGHAAFDETDKAGLSEQRAIAVAAALIDAGIQRERLRVRGFADAQPIDARRTREALARNRRAEFEILERKSDDAVAHTGTVAHKPSVSSAPSTSKLRGGSVRYALSHRVTVAHGETTLVPLINRKVDGEEIFLYRPDASLPGSDLHPMRAARVINDSDVALVPGPVAIFSDESFAGEGLVENVHPGESLLVPFALDRSAAVSVETQSERQPQKAAALANGVLDLVDDERILTTYEVTPGLTPPRRIFIAHVNAPQYRLREVPAGGERTGTITLVPLPLSKKTPSTLRLVEEKPHRWRREIAALTLAELGGYAKAEETPASLRKTLEEILELRKHIDADEDRLAGLRARRFDGQLRMHEIRQNLATVKKASALRHKLLEELDKAERASMEMAHEISVLAERVGEARRRLHERSRGDAPLP